MIVIYHAGCFDGFCAAWVANKYFNGSKYIPARYQEPPPKVDGEEVLIVDFSYPRQVLLDMAKVATKIRVLDHHKTAEADLKDLSASNLAVKFDMSKSGARLTWEYLFPNNRAPGLVDYTEDRDLWTWKLPRSKEVNAALRTLPMDFELWDKLGRLDAKGLEMRLAGEGAAILRAEEQEVARHVDQAWVVEIDGHQVWTVNATTLMSEIGGALAEKLLPDGKMPDFGSCFLETEKGRKYSLRVRGDGNCDVGAIAKKFGGGGHAKASGFVEGLKP